MRALHALAFGNQTCHGDPYVVISIKSYLDADAPALAIDEPESNELLAVTMDSYRSLLRTIGSSASQACPAPGNDLERGLASLQAQLSIDATSSLVKRTQGKVEAALELWGSSTAAHLKGKADEVKELLIILARTAESIGERDQRYASQFAGLTAQLGAIANLDDITQIRSSLIKKASELKSCVDQMTHDRADSLAQLRSKVSVYEGKIEAVEQLASKDPLTGLANRRGIEMRMEWNIKLKRTFSVMMLDLDMFKLVNDKFGHAAGDDLLKKFSEDLQKSVRIEDLVGRWGGDEFVVVLVRDLDGARAQSERIREWVFGDFKIETGTDKGALKIPVAASIGIAQWQPEMSVKKLLEQADADMYRDKKQTRKNKP